MVNLAGQIFTKQGTSIETFPLSSFFLTGTDRQSDPKILYDTQSGRWYASIIDMMLLVTGGVDQSHFNITVAVSTSSDPTGTWKIYGLKTGEILPDQPIIGLSDDKFIVSVNDFEGLIGPFIGAQYWVLNKTEMVNGAATIDFDSYGPNSSLESVHPVQSLSPTSTQYMVSVGGGSLGLSTTTVQLLSITGTPPGTVTVNTTPLTISIVNQPPSGVEPNTSATINTDDFRVLSAVWSQGNLWYSLTDSCIPSGDTTSRSCVRLTEVSTTSPKVVQDFDLGASGTSYYYPAVSMDGQGNLEVIYGYSSSTIFPSLAITGQLTTDLPNTVALPKTLVQGTNNDQSGRYGDYFGAATDPSDTSQVWVAGEYNPTPIGWSTLIASMTMTATYTMTALSTYLNFQPGSSATSVVTLTSIAGFNGTVSLSASVTPSGPTASLNPSSVNLPKSGSANSTLMVSASSTVTPGPYTVSITGSGNGLVKQIIVAVTVGPDFSLSAKPASVSVQAGSLATTTITVRSIANFAGTVTLSASVVPSGPSATFNPASVSLAPGGLANSTLTVTSANPGLFTVTIPGTSGSLRHTATVIAVVKGYLISANSATLSLAAGSSNTATIFVGSSNGFGGNVQLSATVSPSGPTITFNPSTVLLPAGGFSLSSMTVTASSTISAGVYTITVTGANASEASSTTISAIVTPLTLTFNNSTVFSGVTVATTGSLSVDAPTNAPTLSGSLTTTATSSKGKILFTHTYTVTALSLKSSSAGRFEWHLLLNIPISPYTLSSGEDIILTSTGTSITNSVTRTPDIDQNGIVDISDVNTVVASNGCSLHQSCYNPLADLDADGTVDFIDVSTVAFDYQVPNYLPNFTMAASSTSLMVPVGSSASTTITLTSTNTFAGTVSLAILSPSVLTTTLSSSSVTLKSGGSGSSKLTVSSSTLGIFRLNVTGTSGVLSHSTIITIYVADFAMFPDNSALTILTNGKTDGTASTAIEMFGINGLSGTASVSASVTPRGLTATVNPTSVSFPAFGPHIDSFLTVSSHTKGGYVVTVTVTIGSLAHFFDVSVSVCIIGQICNQSVAQGQASTGGPRNGPESTGLMAGSSTSAYSSGATTPPRSDTLLARQKILIQGQPHNPATGQT
jgi:hypothetical protein